MSMLSHRHSLDHSRLVSYYVFNPLEIRGNYRATSNNMKLVHWSLMGGLLHLVQRGGDWVGLQHAQDYCRLDYCNSLLAGVADVHLQRLQSVQNAAARLVSGTPRREHITPVFRESSTGFESVSVSTSRLLCSCGSASTVVPRRT